MKDQDDEPNNKSEQAGRKSDKHQPTQNTKRIKKVAIILAVDDARMHRAFIDSAPVGVRNDAAQDHRAHRRKCERQDEKQKDPIQNPREPFANRQRRRVHESNVIGSVPTLSSKHLAWSMVDGSSGFAGRSRVSQSSPKASRIRQATA